MSWSQPFLAALTAPWGLAEILEQRACLALWDGSVLWPGHSCSWRSRPQASSVQRVARCPPCSLAGGVC